MRNDNGATILDLAVKRLDSERHAEKPDAKSLQASQALIDLLKKHGAKPGEPTPH